MACCIISSSGGCQRASIGKPAFDPVFYPPPPNQARMQFLVSYSGGEDFDVPKESFLETFVLGSSEVSVGTIEKPYGVAIHDDKIYVCDIGQSKIKVMDLKNNTFGDFPLGRKLQIPLNIFIEDNGVKYVADSGGGGVYVYDAEDKLVAILGTKLGIRPKGVTVQDRHLYVTDGIKNQVLILDKFTGKLIKTLGRDVSDEAKAWRPDAFPGIADLTLDHQGNLYVSDKLKNSVTRFDPNGKYASAYGHYGSSPDSLERAKGVAVDKEQRLWVVDAGRATAVKVFRNDGRLLMLFGRLGKTPGQMYMPAGICIDYDNVDYFRKYAVKGAKLEFIVLVTNQFGPHKLNVYGFGTFPPPALLRRPEPDAAPQQSGNNGIDGTEPLDKPLEK